VVLSSTPASSTTKIGRHDIAESGVKNTKNPYYNVYLHVDSFVTVGNYNNTVGGHNYLFFYSSITVCEVPKLSRNVPLGILKNVTMY
jgi:hypothetical protein